MVERAPPFAAPPPAPFFAGLGHLGDADARAVAQRTVVEVIRPALAALP